MLVEVASLIYFFLPAVAANMAPVFFRKQSWLDYPLDFSSRLRGKRLFGGNKTWRGLVVGVVAATLVFFLQQLAHRGGFVAIHLIDYQVFPVWLGSFIGFGALVGDALESAVKRQLDKPPGRPWLPWDQVDFLLAAMLVTVPYWLLFWQAMIVALVVIVFVNLLVQRTGYLLGLKADPF